jgi:hypothetical protein
MPPIFILAEWVMVFRLSLTILFKWNLCHRTLIFYSKMIEDRMIEVEYVEFDQASENDLFQL